MRFLLFSISLLHIHISRLPVFLAVLISCCIFGRPSKRTLMMLPVSHSPSVAGKQRLHCHIESTFIQVQVDFPQNGFRRRRMNLEVDSNHCFGKQFLFSLSVRQWTRHCVQTIFLRERSPENIVSEASEISAPSTFNLIRTENIFSFDFTTWNCLTELLLVLFRAYSTEF